MKKILAIISICLIFCGCGSALGKTSSKLTPTSLHWTFQDMPNAWQDNEWVKGEDVLYTQGMTLTASKQELKIRPNEVLKQNDFSSGFLQSIGNGNVMTIKNVVGPVSIKIHYTGAGRNKIRYPLLKINGELVASGEDSPDTLSPKVLEVNYLQNIPTEITIASNNGVRFYDVIIAPIDIIKPQKIVLDKEKIALSVHERVTIAAEVFPLNASSKTLEWLWKNNTAFETENLSCATVEQPEGMKTSSVQVLALRPGKAVLQVRSVYSKKIVAECAIEVISTFAENNVSKAESLSYIGNSQSVVSAIALADRPLGWANAAGAPENYGGYDSSSSMKIFTDVSTYDELKNALTAATERRIIYVTDTIDLNNNKTPYDYIEECGYAEKFSSYEDYKQQFSATCKKDTQSSLHAIQQDLSSAQRKQARLSVPSNTTIIGTTDFAGIINGELTISGKENIVIRNIRFWNAYDYFPLWYQSGENNFNSIFDNITVDNSKWIWIDHCTLGENPYVYDTVKTPVGDLPWITYDGALDIGNGSQFVTVSWCHFQNHDKTLLIGYGSNYTMDENKLQVTLHHNYFENCKTRLPLVRHGTVHVYNNIYNCPNNKSGFCIGVGYKSQVYAENNVIQNSKYGFRQETLDCDDATLGKIYYVGNNDLSTYWDISKKAPCKNLDWNPSSVYWYSLDDTESLFSYSVAK